MGCQQSKIKPTNQDGTTPSYPPPQKGKHALTISTTSAVSNAGGIRSPMQQRIKVVTIVDDATMERAASPDAALPSDAGNDHHLRDGGACPALRARLASRSKSSSLEGQEPTVFQISESRSIDKMFRRWSRRQLMEQQRAEAAQVMASIARFEALVSQQQAVADDDDAYHSHEELVEADEGHCVVDAVATAAVEERGPSPVHTTMPLSQCHDALTATVPEDGDVVSTSNADEEASAVVDIADDGCRTAQEHQPTPQARLTTNTSGASSPLQLRSSSNSNALLSHSSGSFNNTKPLVDAAAMCNVEDQENAVVVARGKVVSQCDGGCSALPMQQLAAASPNRSVTFDAVAMRQSAPQQAQQKRPPRKQSASRSGSDNSKQRIGKRAGKTSAGRSGPVAPKWDKGSKAHMQTEVYLEMAAAFERMLTNVDTIHAQLDSR